MVSTQKFGAVDRRAIWEAHGERCFYCRRPLAWRDIEIDHIVPERLLYNPVELTRVLRDYGLPIDYDVSSDRNLVPACRPCNGDKASRLPEAGQMVILLTRAVERASVIERLRERYKRARKGDAALIDAVTAVQNGGLTREQVLAALDGLESDNPALALYRSLEFADGAPVSELCRTDVDLLLDREVYFGEGWPGGVDFEKAGEEIVVHTVREYRQAVGAGFTPNCNAAIKAASAFELVDGVLRAAARAKPAQRSYIREPRVGVCDLHLLPADFLPCGPDFACPSAISIEDLLKTGHVEIKSVTSYSIVYECDYMLRVLVELMRADINEDGIEDLLVYCYDAATQGSMGGGTTLLLTRRSTDGLFEELPWHREECEEAASRPSHIGPEGARNAN